MPFIQFLNINLYNKRSRGTTLLFFGRKKNLSSAELGQVLKTESQAILGQKININT
jgi:hypothetical protein